MNSKLPILLIPTDKMTEIFPEGDGDRGWGISKIKQVIRFHSLQVTASELLHSVTEHGYALTDDEVI